jgi:putative PEP-CTERM system histidine kinase
MLTWVTPFFSASVISITLACIFAVQFYRKRSCYSLTIAALFNSFWLFSLTPSKDKLGIPNELDLFFECMHYSIWILAISRAFPETILSRNLRIQQLIFWATWLTTFTIFVLLYSGAMISQTIGSFISLIFTISTIWCVEKLYQTCLDDRQIKVLCVSIGILLFYDLFFHTYNLFNQDSFTASVHIRASVYLAACFIMAIGLITLSPSTPHTTQKLKLSKKAAFYGSTILTSAIFLTLILIGAYYIQGISGNWITTTFIFITFTTIFCIVTIYSSSQVRAKIVVFINKNFFSHIYDYREEWLKISNLLSQGSGQSPYKLSLEITMKTFNSHAGILWVKHNNHYIPKHNTTTLTSSDLLIEPSNSDFLECMTKNEWIFYPSANYRERLGTHNKLLPGWAQLIDDLWIICPLLTNNELIGFIALTNTANKRPNWEDLDLLKAIGSQLAAHIKLHLQEEKLEEQLQLNIYNKLSSFVMHDLNNLIAQQDLVVKNADKHINNPAFVADAISTVRNSVERMQNLLFKLKRNKPEDSEELDLIQVIKQAIDYNKRNLPYPSFNHPNRPALIKADKEKLTMSISHLIKNAQDATPTEGTVHLSLEYKVDKIILCIEDTGIGMEPDFIQNKLFKPFESTKSGTGMGIGVYLTRDYIEQLGGALTVKSTPKLGTTFTIELDFIQ